MGWGDGGKGKGKEGGIREEEEGGGLEEGQDRIRKRGMKSGKRGGEGGGVEKSQ